MPSACSLSNSLMSSPDRSSSMILSVEASNSATTRRLVPCQATFPPVPGKHFGTTHWARFADRPPVPVGGVEAPPYRECSTVVSDRGWQYRVASLIVVHLTIGSSHKWSDAAEVTSDPSTA